MTAVSRVRSNAVERRTNTPRSDLEGGGAPPLNETTTLPRRHCGRLATLKPRPEATVAVTIGRASACAAQPDNNAVAIAANGRGVGERRGLSVSGDRLEQSPANQACLAQAACRLRPPLPEL